MIYAVNYKCEQQPNMQVTSGKKKRKFLRSLKWQLACIVKRMKKRGRGRRGERRREGGRGKEGGRDGGREGEREHKNAWII